MIQWLLHIKNSKNYLWCYFVKTIFKAFLCTFTNIFNSYRNCYLHNNILHILCYQWRQSYISQGKPSFQGPNNIMKKQSKNSHQVPVQCPFSGAPLTYWWLSAAGWMPHEDQIQMGRVSRGWRMWTVKRNKQCTTRLERNGAEKKRNCLTWCSSFQSQWLWDSVPSRRELSWLPSTSFSKAFIDVTTSVCSR